MNRLCDFIPDSRIKFSKTISKFDYRMLMNQNCEFSISSENAVVKAYDYWNSRISTFLDQEENKKDQELMKYKLLRQRIIEDSGESLNYIVNTLVAYLYTVRPTSPKKSLWGSFGDVIVENLKVNVEGKGKICPICGKRFVPKRIDQTCCNPDCATEYDNQNRRKRRSANNA